jgi:two-component system cell cycle sensor histidine kinase/response regulator CckA
LTADAVSVTTPVLLLVEDEPMLRRVVAITLRREGFDVLEAGDGTEGLEILQSGQLVDVLLTDVRMPNMDGYRLAEASLSLRPQLPVILMTGYTDEEMPDAIRRAAIPMIRKPFNFANLAVSIRGMMQR